MDKAGHLHMPTVVGLLAFQNFWYWFPVSHLLSLAFTPAAVICLNEDLEVSVVAACLVLCVPLSITSDSSLGCRKS